MRLKYPNHDGTVAEIELGEKPITVGRSPEADIVIYDEKTSRIHCGIRFWDGDYYVKDLKSKNGTYVNGHRIEVSSVKPGDEIRIGATVLSCLGDSPGADTALRELKDQMELGKGYSTILREIVGDKPAAAAPEAEALPVASPAASSAAPESTEPAPAPPAEALPEGEDAAAPVKPPKKKIRLVIKRPPGKGPAPTSP
jgi:predicted component of type VI protein secretion system